MTTSLDTLVVPLRYYTALDPYNWKVDNRPISDLEDNDDVLRSGVETALNAVKTGAAIDGRILRSLVGLDKASGDWTLHPSAVTITLTDLIKGSVVSDDGFDVGVIAAQYSPAVFALATPAAGLKNLVTISATYKLPSTADMPYYDSTQGLDALMTTLATAQTKQGTLEFAIATTTVAVGDPDNYFVPSGGYQTLFNIKILETDTVLDTSRVIAVGITKHGQAVAQATNSTYGQVRFATGIEVTTGTSTNTVVSPADLATRALLEGDPAVNFQVEDAVDLKDAVNLGQMLSATGVLFNESIITPIGVASEVLVPTGCKRIEVLMVAQGGGGGGGANTNTGGGGGGAGSPGQVIEFTLYPARDAGSTKSISKLIVQSDSLFGNAGLGGYGAPGATLGGGASWTLPGGDGYDGGDMSFAAISYDDNPSGLMVFGITAKGGKKGLGSTGTAGGIGASPTTTTVERLSVYEISGLFQRSSVGGPNYISSYTGRAGENGQSTSVLPSVPLGGQASTLTGNYVSNTYSGDSRGRGGAGGPGTPAGAVDGGDGANGGQPMCRIRFHYR